MATLATATEVSFSSSKSIISVQVSGGGSVVLERRADAADPWNAVREIGSGRTVDVANASAAHLWRLRALVGTPAVKAVDDDATLSLISGRSPVDTLGQPTVARQLAVSGTTANQALTSTCRRITIRARGCPMRYEVGVGAQTASATTSHFLDQDERLDLSVPAGANIAAIAIPPWGSSTTGTGSLAITELA